MLNRFTNELWIVGGLKTGDGQLVDLGVIYLCGGIKGAENAMREDLDVGKNVASPFQTCLEVI